MKKLTKLNINPEKVMKNEELIALRGGYDGGYLTCYINGVTCWHASIITCDEARNACNEVCGSWTELICTGW